MAVLTLVVCLGAAAALWPAAAAQPQSASNDAPGRTLLIAVGVGGLNPAIYSLTENGKNLKQLAGGFHAHVWEIEPSWSPDGTKIVYASTRGFPVSKTADGPSEIWEMNADGSGKRKLTDTGSDLSYPVWSPDGTQISTRSALATSAAFGSCVATAASRSRRKRAPTTFPGRPTGS